MLSGNGRHRRPRQAPALVVAAGVTGSAIAIPLLGATGAHAADGANWDRVAECETGGAWSQNSGNGYYGGLQLTQEVWERYGGLQYASSADQASRSQQIRIAEKLHADQGIAAWPTCGLLAGLGNDASVVGGGTGSTGDGASEEADDASATPAPTASGSAGSGGSADSGEPDRSGRSSGAAEPTAGASSSPSSSASSSAGQNEGATSDTPDTSDTSDPAAGAGREESAGSSAPVTKGDESDKAGQSDGSSSLTGTGESGAGKHRGGSADEGPVDGRTAESSGRHASRDEGGAREAVDGAYTVRSGDSLWGIADSLEVDGGWRSLYAGNKDVVGVDPDHILPGQTLTVTGESGEK
ncbi:transglycosylase family protein [Streptomyces sp. BK79]|uniref:transglycosylase family protein n=1 Tax=Streptomyces sp. BK79 TaxID=3350097 RepID=UPI00376F8799